MSSTRDRIFVETRSLGVSLCVGVFTLLSALPLHAAPGDPDPTFGDGGHAAFSVPGIAAVGARASVLQANGKLTVAGSCDAATAEHVCVLRMTSNGAPAEGFGNEGRVIIAGVFAESGVHAIAYQDDGRLLLGGRCLANSSRSPCVVRLQASGALDTSFGAQGVAILSVSTWNGDDSHVRSIQTLTDGRIALGVSCRPTGLSAQRFCAARLQSNGALDPSFGLGGVVTVMAEVSQGESQWLRAAATDGAGRWVMAGHCSGSPLPDTSFCAVRLQPNGARDLSFGTNGAYVYTSSSQPVFSLSSVDTAILNADGAMVLGGRCLLPAEEPPIHVPCFAALTSTGHSDQAFGAQGFATVRLSLNSASNVSFVRQSDGSLLTALTVNTSQTGFDFSVAQLHSDGSFTTRLLQITVGRPLNQRASAVAVDAQGRIVVLGSCQSSTNSSYDQFCATRLEGGPYANTMCSFDLDGDGRVRPSVDGLILVRASLGFSADTILQGVNFSMDAKRTVWGGGGANDLRQYLVAQCGMSIAPIAITN
jgi:uncharacterized delta-60 repeat protein